MKKVIAVVVGLVMFGGVAQAQKPIKAALDAHQAAVQLQNARELARWKNKILSGNKQYIQASAYIGQELIKSSISSVGETSAYARKVKWGEKLSSVCPSGLYERLISRHMLERAFPGYEVDFRSRWREKAVSSDFSISAWNLILEETYGPEAKFAGTFVRSWFEVITYRFYTAKMWGSANRAIMQALSESHRIKSGFFILAVKSPTMEQKDILILDLNSNRFISLNQSYALTQQPTESEHAAPLAQ